VSRRSTRVNFSKSDCGALIGAVVALGRTNIGNQNSFDITDSLERNNAITIREEIEAVLEVIEEGDDFFAGVDAAGTARAFKARSSVDGITENVVQELVEADDTRGAWTGVHSGTEFEITREGVFGVFFGGDVIEGQHDGLDEFERVEEEAEHVETATSNVLQVRFGFTTTLQERNLERHEAVTDTLDLDDAEASSGGVHEGKKFVEHGDHRTTRSNARNAGEVDDVCERDPADGEMFVKKNGEAAFAAVRNVGVDAGILLADGASLSGGLLTELADVGGCDGSGDVERENGVQKGSGFLVLTELEDVEKHDDAEDAD